MTSRQFAKLIGVSQSTVSRALSDSPNVTAETKEYILAKAMEYGFMLNSQARSLKTKKTNSIGILFPTYFNDMSHNLMFTYIYDKLQRELIKRDYDIIAIAGNEKDKTGKHVLQRIVRSGKIDGVINFQPKLSDNKIKLIESFHLPCVSLHTGGRQREHMHQLILDEYDAGYQVGEIFAASNRLNVYIGTNMTEPEEEERFCGYRDALCHHGRKVDKVLRCAPQTTQVMDLIGEKLDDLSTQPVNLFVYNDLMALAATRKLCACQLRIPQQVQVISMDNIPMATWFKPMLSTMATPVDEMVQACCNLIISLVQGQEVQSFTQKFKSTFIARETTLTP